MSMYYYKKRKKSMCLLIAIIMGLSLFFSYKEKLYATTNVNQEDLIINVCNPSTGVIKFTLNIPAGVTVSYSLKLVPNSRTGSLDTSSGTCKNSGTKTIKKTITVNVKYFSDKYTISASYYKGPSKNRTCYKDTDKAVSKLKSTIYTNKFIWDDKNIRKYKNGQKVYIVLSFAIATSIDIIVSKGLAPMPLASILNLTLMMGDVSSADGGASTQTIRTTPIKGWGYQIKYVPNTDGYTKYLLVYNDKNKLHETHNLGKEPYSIITLMKK